MANNPDQPYRNPYPINLYGGMGLGDDRTNAIFDHAWVSIQAYLLEHPKLSRTFAGENLTRFGISLRLIANQYLEAKSMYYNFSATTQKKRARSIIKKIDNLNSDLIDLWKVNLPRRPPAIRGQDPTSVLLGLLAELRSECQLVASQNIQPGAAKATHVRDAAKDFIKAYNKIAEDKFQLSKRGMSQGYLKSPGPELLYHFLHGIDPETTRSNVAAVVATAPMSKNDSSK